MLEIDGSQGEGGGQMLRTALSISCAQGEPVRVSNIRAGRDKPGLRPQHLGACRLLAEISGGNLEGGSVGSKEIAFAPGKIAGGKFSFDIGTAGSCTLLLQAVLPALLLSDAGCELSVKGGTHVRGAPTYEYFAEVFLPAIRRFGAKCESRLLSHGFYPRGGGEIIVSTEPSRLKGIALLPEKTTAARYLITSSSLPPHVARREEEKLKEMAGNIALAGDSVSVPSEGAGNAVAMWSGLHGGCAVGERGKPAEKVAEEACASFLAGAGTSAVDEHLADQLLIYAALASGRTTYLAPRETGHLETNSEALRRLTGRNIILDGKGGTEVL